MANEENAVTEQKEPALALPLSVGQALVNYLVTRPYNETAGLIRALESLSPVSGSENVEG